MLRLFHITKDYPEMAFDEVIALAGQAIVHRFDDLIVIDTDQEGLASRLAYCRAVYRFLFVCKESGLKDAVSRVDWASLCYGSFAVRFQGHKSQEGVIAAQVGSILPSLGVDLKTPDTRIDLFHRDGDIICGILEGENRGDFESRKTHKRKAPHPSSMHPKLCRWFVNRTGIKGGVLTDPFCGSGGILIEAALMGFDVEGYDIDPDMVARAAKNLQGIAGDPRLEVRDALSLRKGLGFVATDLPYGRATKAKEIIPLYEGFLDFLEGRLAGRAVVGYPDFIDFEEMAAKRPGLKVQAVYDIYIHKSLTKMVIVLDAR